MYPPTPNLSREDFDSYEQKHQKSIFLIEVERIKPNPMQPRREFNDAALADLAESIRQYGVLQPLVVTRRELEVPTGTAVEYELISGERRLRAARIAGLAQVPVMIRDERTGKMKLELAIIENLQREDLNAVERAEAFERLTNEFGLKHHEIAGRVGKSRVFVSNTIRLLGLPEEMREALRRGLIYEGHARPLLMLTDRAEEQQKLFNEMMGRKMPIREAEEISRTIAVEKSRKLRANARTALGLEARELARRLSDTLGTRVIVEPLGEDGGRISIDFFSTTELRSFLDRVAASGESREVAPSASPPMAEPPEEPGISFSL